MLVCAVVVVKLVLLLSCVYAIVLDVGGGFGVKIVYLWFEEVFVLWVVKCFVVVGFGD